MPDTSALQRKYKLLAKMIDERLRQMEKAGQTRYGYQVAEREFKHLFGKSGRPRFEKKLPDDIRVLRAGINALETIKNLDSTTKSGMKRVTGRAAATLNKHYKGLNINRDQLGGFFESGMYKELLAKGYSSDTIVKGIAKMRQDQERIQKSLDRWGEYHVHGNYRNDTVRKFIEDQVNKEGFDLETMFEGLGF